MDQPNHQLPKVAFSILLALSLRERHGYEIIKQVEDDSNHKIKLGPGVLYTSIKQLLKRGFIEEVKHAEDTPRRYYKLTAAGSRALESELKYYDNAVSLAKQRQVFHSSNYDAA